MVTWNVATAEPPEDLTSLLQLDDQPPTDLYVIGWEREQNGEKTRLKNLDLKDENVSFNDSARKEGKALVCQWVVFSHSPVCVCVCISLQEVSATPVRFISDLLVEDSWSHVFMDTLAPRGFIKVRRDRGRERSVDRYRQNGCVYLNS